MSFWQDFKRAGNMEKPKPLKADGKKVINDTFGGINVTVRICPHNLSYLDCAECLDWGKISYVDMTSKPRFVLSWITNWLRNMLR